jgi:hypothetical protein
VHRIVLFVPIAQKNAERLGARTAVNASATAKRRPPRSVIGMRSLRGLVSRATIGFFSRSLNLLTLGYHSAVAIVRTGDELAVVDGEVCSLEWLWAADGSMPGLDVSETLDDEATAALIATFRHGLPHAKRPAESRINEENADAKIPAAKQANIGLRCFTQGTKAGWSTDTIRKATRSSTSLGKPS